MLTNIQNIQKIVYILDSSAFFASFYEEGVLLITIDTVVDEVRDTASAMHLSVLQEKGMRVEPVNALQIKSVLDAARKTQDIDKLSETDIQVLAKAKEHDGTIVTDDYAIQNVAAVLGIKVRSLMQKKIRSVYIGVRKCTGCGHKSESETICSVCGTPTKRMKSSFNTTKQG